MREQLLRHAHVRWQASELGSDCVRRLASRISREPLDVCPPPQMGASMSESGQDRGHHCSGHPMLGPVAEHAVHGRWRIVVGVVRFPGDLQPSAFPRQSRGSDPDCWSHRGLRRWFDAGHAGPRPALPPRGGRPPVRLRRLPADARGSVDGRRLAPAARRLRRVHGPRPRAVGQEALRRLPMILIHALERALVAATHSPGEV
mmetsp:Transcript_123670/g.385080  ORF Transcript_123670/g.385080 Transcript_123670/m.385080 type:complete len:202 (+) Transcript_123670:233-838(+)